MGRRLVDVCLQVQGYRGIQNDENKIAAYELLKTPDDYVAHFERYATSVVSIIGYGRRIPTTTDPIITEVINLMHRAAALNVPGKTFPMLMETFPCKPYQPVPASTKEQHVLTSTPQFWPGSPTG